MIVVICCYRCDVYTFIFFFKQKTAYEMRISDWSSDVCSSDLKISHSPRPKDEAPSDGRRRDPCIDCARDYRNVLVIPTICPYRGGSAQIGRASCRERVCQYV